MILFFSPVFFTFEKEKQTTVAKKLELDINLTDSYVMLGIVTPLPDYQLAHYLNLTLKVSFKKYDDFLFGNSGKKNSFYPWFFCFSETYKIKAFLIGNYHPAKRLIPEYKHIDYFILLENNSDATLLDNLMKNIRKIKSVTAVFKLNIETIKNIDYLLEENEMHEMSCVSK